MRWVDARGRFVDRYRRVLTADGQRVEKQYLLAQDANRNFVLPVKLRQHFDAHHQATYIPGLPNVFGGTMDPEDADPHAAVSRELGEESDFAQEITAAGSQLRASADVGGNRFNIRTGAIAATTAPQQVLARAAARPFTQEMDLLLGDFRFRASEITYVHGTTTDLQIKNQILALFAARKGVNLGDPFFTAAVPGRAQTPLEEFRDSHVIAQLVDKVKEDSRAYDRGLQAKRAAAVDATETDPEYLGALADYDQGQAAKQGGAFDPARPDAAYVAAGADYDQGLQEKRQNTFVGARPVPAYRAAGADYDRAVDAKQHDAFDNAATAPAYLGAGADYDAGWADAKADRAPLRPGAAYLAGHAAGKGKRKKDEH